MKLQAMPRTRAAFAEWRDGAAAAGVPVSMVPSGHRARVRFAVDLGPDRFEFEQERLDPVAFELRRPTREQLRAVEALAELGALRVTDWRG